MSDDFIQFAYAMSGPDRGRRLTDDERIAAALAAPEPAWIHMRTDRPETRAWIARHLDYIAEPIRTALLQDETRPRATVHGDGVLVILRGVNTNPGAEPEDMVAVRLWVQAGRIVSLGRRPLASLSELAEVVGSGAGPDRAGAFLCGLVERLNARIDAYLTRTDDETDLLEENVLRDPDKGLRARVTDLRGELVDIRRFLVPQREAVATLARTQVDLIDPDDRGRLEEALERLTRAVEEVESLRDRLIVVKDELNTALSDRLNKNLYLLSVISAVFLPLGVLTGLMGINLAGMPGANWPPAFWVFTGLLGVILAIQIAILWVLRWF